MPRSILISLAVASTAPIASNVHPQSLKPAQPVNIERVKGDLYMISGEGGNVAVYVTAEGVILVDDMFYRNADDIVAKVATVTDQPIVYVLNTHQHDDHAGGNAKLLEIANVIAQENVRVNLSDIKQPYYEDTPGTPIGLPNITFADNLTVHVGGKEVRAHYFGRGHTNGDAIIYFPAEGVIHTGDMFLARNAAAAAAAAGKPPGRNIYVDYVQGGSFLAWTDTLNAALQLDFDTIVPGHGPVAARADLVQFNEDVIAMRDRVGQLVRSGASKQQVVTLFEMDYGWRATGCPPSPPTGGCLQFQQMDALIEELRAQ
jgi:glyoxylase-like metal-dependent hydrolase (beta-lactamase superfamily II)